MHFQPQTALSDSEIERYSRQLILPQIGGAGQQKLKAAKILVIGAGGLGASVLHYLSAAGVGCLGIVDNDRVELSNLQRQIIHGSDNIGLLKTQSAQSAIYRLNAHVNVKSYNFRLEETNSQDLFANYDVIIDCSDNFTTHYLITDTAHKVAKPCISGAIRQFDGMLTLLAPYENNNPTYRDIFPETLESQNLPTCSTSGVIGAAAGVIGSLQAMEAIKHIVGIGNNLIGKLLLYHGLETRFKIINYKRSY